VDEAGHVLGIVRVDDIIDALVEDSTEDAHAPVLAGAPGKPISTQPQIFGCGAKATEQDASVETKATP